MASQYPNYNQPAYANVPYQPNQPYNDPSYNQQNFYNQENFQRGPDNSDWTSYPQGNVNPVDIGVDRDYGHNRGVVLSQNCKNCLLATAIASFVIFIILWIS